MYSYSWGYHFYLKRKMLRWQHHLGISRSTKNSPVTHVSLLQSTSQSTSIIQLDMHGATPGLLQGGEVGEAHSVPSQSVFSKYQKGRKWPFLVNTDGLGTTLSFYFERIQSEPELQLETCGKSLVLKELAAWLLSPSSGPALAPPHSPKVLHATSCPEKAVFSRFSPLLSLLSLHQIIEQLAISFGFSLGKTG